ncbi:MAG TPA: hypothetical protein VMR54_00585 [Thermoanaerobaculia bacterium]|nr:hypothetical protein [Thermoanaerobaculia bacterium]
MKRLAGIFLLLFLAAAAAQAYVVKLKDGSLVFARIKYEVKGAKAIITLENGTVTQIDLDKVDVPGTDEYNKKYSGNVIAIDTPDQKIINQREAVPTPATRLQDLAKTGKLRPSGLMSAPGTPSSAPGSWQPVDPLVQAAFSKVFDGGAIPQWRLTNYRGKVRLLVTTNSEEAVFTVLSAAARALNDLTERGKDTVIEIVLTTSTNEPAGAFDMGPEQAKQLVNGTIAVGDYFVRNVNL